MPAAMMVSGVGFILIGVAAFLRNSFSGGSSTTVAKSLGEFNLFYYDGNAVRILNDLMFLPFSPVALAIGTAAFIAGAGLGSWRGL